MKQVCIFFFHAGFQRLDSVGIHLSFVKQFDFSLIFFDCAVQVTSSPSNEVHTFFSLSSTLSLRAEMMRTEIKRILKSCLKLFLSPPKNAVKLTKGKVSFDGKFIIIFYLIGVAALSCLH